jgi:hypothetical protein
MLLQTLVTGLAIGGIYARLENIEDIIEDFDQAMKGIAR